MKNWKLIIGLVVIAIIVISILIINKKKLSANTSGGIDLTYYVTVEKVQKKNLETKLTLTGTIYANNDVNILSETSGKVIAVYAKVGDYKQANSVIVQVDDELRKAALMSAEANFEKAKKDFERFQKLYSEKSITEGQLDQAKVGLAMAETQYIVAKRQFEDTKIKTPISGYITARNVDVGTMLQGAPQPTFVANVVDLSRVKVKINFSEIDAATFKVGDQVKVTTDVYPNVVFNGRIESISNKADEAHTYPTEISIVNQSKNLLRAGMFARVELNSTKNRDVIVIPREALVGSVKNPQVYVVENNIAKLKNIVIGSESGIYVQVINGLNVGDIIVVNGQNNLEDNTKVEILNK
ncbi:MAG: efflux RND transporter periplasmic adaptor subunit [Melioribacteraceae bacterium]|nr:efflux RND transporter periplasmic adaptor subunit [Melioribacteraceae bacterium]